MIRSRESLSTHPALEWFLSRVSAIVACEFVRASKRPITSLPGTSEGLLSGVYPLVRLEVRALGVPLGTVGVVTVVHPLHF